MKKLMLVVTAALFLGACALTDEGRSPSVGVTIGGQAPAPAAGPPPWAPAHGRRAKETAYSYYYYPTAGVYFNTSTRIYFYLNGGAWQASATLPPSVVIDTGDYVSIELDTGKPYLYYDEHKVKFKGKKGPPHKKGKKKKISGPPF